VSVDAAQLRKIEEGAGLMGIRLTPSSSSSSAAMSI